MQFTLVFNIGSSIKWQWTSKLICTSIEKALKCHHEDAEDYLVRHFEDSMLCFVHTKRVTLMPKDIVLACKI